MVWGSESLHKDQADWTRDQYYGHGLNDKKTCSGIHSVESTDPNGRSYHSQQTQFTTTWFPLPTQTWFMPSFTIAPCFLQVVSRIHIPQVNCYHPLPSFTSLRCLRLSVTSVHLWAIETHPHVKIHHNHRWNWLVELAWLVELTGWTGLNRLVEVTGWIDRLNRLVELTGWTGWLN
jgi:hypothetical protein